MLEQFLCAMPLRLQSDRRLLILILLAIGGVGITSIIELPRMEDPPLSQRALSVTTLLPGADATQVEAKVTEKIESYLLEVPELKYLRSQSRAGASWISFELEDSVSNTEDVWSRVRRKVEEAKSELPKEATEPVVEDTSVSAYAWIGAVVWNTDSEANYGAMRRYALQYKDSSKAIPGTKLVDIFGEPQEEILVQVDAHQAARLGLSIEAISARLSLSDAKDAAGMVYGSQTELGVKVENEFQSLDDIARTVLRQGDDGEVLRLCDVANIQRQVLRPARSLVIVNGKPAIVVGIKHDPRHSIETWTKQVGAMVADFRASLPQEMQFENLLVQNHYVSVRLKELAMNLLLGCVAVGLVTMLFMGTRAALLVSIMLPLTSCMVLGGMRVLGIPMHQMSVTGLVLSLGLLVDNAIIIVDEVERLRRNAVGAKEIIRTIIKRLTMPLVGSTLTTALAFCPLAFMQGPTGEFVGSIGMTVILSVCSSLILALLFLPALATKVFAVVPETNHANKTWSDVLKNGVKVPQLTASYRTWLNYLFRRPALGIAVGCALPAIGGIACLTLPEQFFPAADRNQFQIEVELDASASQQATRQYVERVESIVRQRALEIANTSWYLGGSGPAFYYNQLPLRSNTPSYAQGIIEVKGRLVDKRLLAQLQQDLNAQLVEGRATVRLFEQGPPVNAPIEIRLYGQDDYVLQALGGEVRQRLRNLPDVLHVRSDMSETRPLAKIQLDPARVRSAGLSERSVAGQVYSQLEGLSAGYLQEKTEMLPVRIRTADKHSRLGALDELSVFTEPHQQQSKNAPLKALGTIRIEPERAAITRMNGERVNEIHAFVAVGALPSIVLKRLQADLANEPIAMPYGYRLEFGGETSERAAAVGNLLSHVPLVALATLCCLVIALQSFRLAAIISAIGVFSIGLGTGALWLLGYPLGFTAIVGTIGLIGVAVNDSIVVLSALREDQKARHGNVEAAVDTVMGCTRHVLCTTLTTVAGFLPLILGGGEFWPPLAVVIGVGILGATVTALTFLPCSYLWWFANSKDARKSQDDIDGGLFIDLRQKDISADLDADDEEIHWEGAGVLTDSR